MENANMDLKTLLLEGAERFDVDLSKEQTDEFLYYKEILKQWNEKINLTAIEDDREIVIKHFIDSLSIAPYIKNRGKSIIDIGTGGGFPGIPLKIIFPFLKVTLLDSLEKRIKFLNEVINRLNLNGISAVHSRAEDKGTDSDYREKYDMAVARAVASLPVLLEYCLPFVKVGGIFIAMKGSNTEEVEGSAKALDILGGKIEDVVELELPLSDIKRNIIIVKKFRQTSTRYPRKAGKPSKDPLV
jgi:16S rRNA (guanine527-N7)-methyltransferase